MNTTTKLTIKTVLATVAATALFAGCTDREESRDPVPYRPGTSIAGDARAPVQWETTAGSGTRLTLGFADELADAGTAKWDGTEWEVIRWKELADVKVALVRNDDYLELSCGRFGGGITHCVVITAGNDASLEGSIIELQRSVAVRAELVRY